MSKSLIKSSVILTALLIIASCSKNDPGPLEGTWKMSGPIPMTITFRKGEAESFGLIDEVSYKVKGNEVIVTAETGISVGSSMRYTIIQPGIAKTSLGTLRRVSQ